MNVAYQSWTYPSYVATTYDKCNIFIKYCTYFMVIKSIIAQIGCILQSAAHPSVVVVDL